MDSERKAPQTVIDQAEKIGFNTVRYLGSYKGSDVWGLYDVDADGSVVPTGLPVMILYKDGSIDVVGGMKSFDVLDNLDETLK